MNKKELAVALAQKANLSVKDAEAFLLAYQDVIADAIKSGDKVAIGGFGTYELKTKSARTGFNPITKEPVSIPASKAPNLKFGKAYKDLFN